MIEAVLVCTKSQIIWYHMESTSKIKQGYRIDYSGTSVTGCTCAAFRLKRSGDCSHIKYLRSIELEIHGDPFIEGEVAIIHEKDGIRDIDQLEAPYSGVHAHQIMEALDKGEPILGIDGTSSVRSFTRFVSEFEEAFNKSISLTNGSITGISISEGVVAPVKDHVSKSKDVPKEPKKIVLKRWEVAIPDDFYVEKEMWEALLWVISAGKTALLLGPTGVGKTEICYRAAKAMGIPIEPFNFGAMSEPRISLIGATHFDKEKGTFFNQSRFVAAIQKESMVVLMDELSRSVRDAMNMIFPLLDHQGYVSLDESEAASVVYRGNSVSFLATANVGYEYTGTEAIDRALLDRMAFKFRLDYPPPANELDITMKRFACDRKLMMKIIDTSAQQRSMCKDGEFVTSISTRMVLDCASALADGVSPKAAVKFSIMNCFSDEGGAESERVKAVALFQKRAPELC